MDYSKTYLIGSYLEEAVAKSFSLCGYHVREHKVTDGGVDAYASNKNEKIVCECWNWKNNAYPEEERIGSIIENLNDHPNATKILITANKVDYGEFKNRLKRNGIKVVTLGKQLLSKSSDNLVLVLRKLIACGVLYFNVNYTNRKRKIKRSVLTIMKKKPIESFFGTSMTVLFYFLRAFCANFSPKCSDTRFSVTSLMKKERKKSDKNDK